VVAHRLFGEGVFVSDTLVVPTLRDARKHLLLAPREIERGALFARAPLEHLLGDGVAEPGAAAVERDDRVHQGFGGFVFEQVPVDARACEPSGQAAPQKKGLCQIFRCARVSPFFDAQPCPQGLRGIGSSWTLNTYVGGQ
ncbi:MAG: hypothetical protein AAF065_15450, partial [Verrucomicrobiota bacterium]